MRYLMIIGLCVGVFSGAFAQTTKDYPKDVEYKKFIEQIAGQWELQQIEDAESRDNRNKNLKKPSKTNDPAGDQANNAMRKIEFFDNARYRMSNATNAIDSGSYRLNEQHGILYLQSDLGDTTPTEWKIALERNRLSLTGRGQEATSRYRYIYQKTKDKVVK
jgi:hypothetical protein